MFSPIRALEVDWDCSQSAQAISERNHHAHSALFPISFWKSVDTHHVDKIAPLSVHHELDALGHSSFVFALVDGASWSFWALLAGPGRTCLIAAVYPWR